MRFNFINKLVERWLAQARRWITVDGDQVLVESELGLRESIAATDIAKVEIDLLDSITVDTRAVYVTLRTGHRVDFFEEDLRFVELLRWLRTQLGIEVEWPPYDVLKHTPLPIRVWEASEVS